MHIDEFFTIIHQQQIVIPWLHTTHAGLTDGGLLAWQQTHPHLILPADLLPFLRRSNGVGLTQTKIYGELTGEAVFIFQLEKFERATQAMYGVDDDDHTPASWYAIGRDIDGTQFLIWNVDSSTYWLVPPIVPDEAECIGTQFTDCLTWLAQFLPSPAELASMSRDDNG